MNDVPISVPPAPDPSGQAASGARRGGRLVRRTFLIALTLVCGGLLTSGAVELVFRYRESVDAIGALQREMAQGAAFKIQQFVQDIEQTLRASTQTQDIVTNGLTEPYKFELLKMLKVAPAITELVALDASGREQLKVSRVRMLLSDDLRDRASAEAFQGARHGKAFFGQVYFIRESEPYMTVAVPIERFAGDVVGVLVAEVNLKYIWEVVSRIKVGKAGYAYVVSREGDLIAHPDISLVLQKRQVKQLSQVQAALAGAPMRFVAQPNLAGQRVFAASATIPELGWAVLLERPAAEAYAPLYASILRTGILLLVGLGMAVLASLLIGRRVVRPLALLQQGAARLGSGDLDYRLAVTTADEFQTLADEFNRMASQLQGSYANLEQRSRPARRNSVRPSSSRPLPAKFSRSSAGRRSICSLFWKHSSRTRQDCAVLTRGTSSDWTVRCSGWRSPTTSPPKCKSSLSGTPSVRGEVLWSGGSPWSDGRCKSQTSWLTLNTN
jgi:HAMP domain-containing protein